jgi:hypothetical protein
MTDVAEALIAEGLMIRADELEQQLSATVKLLHSYRGEPHAARSRRFAEAEVAYPDPVSAKRVASRGVEPLA